MNNMEYYDEFVLFFGAGTVARPTMDMPKISSDRLPPARPIEKAGTVARPTPGMTEFRRVGHRADRPCEQRHSYERYSQNKFNLYRI